jgi:hypothetical protein
MVICWGPTKANKKVLMVYPVDSEVKKTGKVNQYILFKIVDVWFNQNQFYDVMVMHDCMKINTNFDQKAEISEDFKDLKAYVREKAIEIAANLTDSDIPEGSTKIKEAIRRAEEWFTDLEG